MVQPIKLGNLRCKLQQNVLISKLISPNFFSGENLGTCLFQYVNLNASWKWLVREMIFENCTDFFSQ